MAVTGHWRAAPPELPEWSGKTLGTGVLTNPYGSPSQV